MAALKARFNGKGEHAVMIPVDYSYIRDPFEEIYRRYRQETGAGSFFSTDFHSANAHFVVVGNNETLVQSFLPDDARASTLEIV